MAKVKFCRVNVWLHDTRVDVYYVDSRVFEDEEGLIYFNEELYEYICFGPGIVLQELDGTFVNESIYPMYDNIEVEAWDYSSLFEEEEEKETETEDTDNIDDTEGEDTDFDDTKETEVTEEKKVDSQLEEQDKILVSDIPELFNTIPREAFHKMIEAIKRDYSLKEIMKKGKRILNKFVAGNSSL